MLTSVCVPLERMWWRSILVPGSFRARFRLRPQGRDVITQDSETHKCFGTSTAFCTKKDEPVAPVDNTGTKTSQNQVDKKMQATAKKNLLNIISEMKVEISTKKKFQMLKSQKIKDQPRDLPENMESASSMFQKATENKAKSSKTVNPELVAAASAVASSLPFDRKRTVSELLQLLKKHKEVTDARKSGEATGIRHGSLSTSNRHICCRITLVTRSHLVINQYFKNLFLIMDKKMFTISKHMATFVLRDIIANMKIGRKPPTRDAFRPSNQIQFDDDGRGYMIDRSVPREIAGTKRRGLYSGKRLNIFTPPPATEEPLETVTTPTLWDLELAMEIAAVSQQPARNGFEEMIQWTKDGKLWEFPINNETGLEDDAEFHEHIFLDKYLEDFPKEGPIRHFMELVTCGLSKNPYLSVKEKVEHIGWFRNYFKEKEELLREIEEHEKEILIEREKILK